MSSETGYLGEQSELLFHFGEFPELWLGRSWRPTSPGLAFSKTLQPHYSLDKQVWTYWAQTQNNPARSRHFPLSLLCLWSGSVCLSHSIPGCLFAWHLSGLAYFLLDLISQCEDLWRPSPHLALWISASSVPVSAVRDWLTPTQSPVFAPGPTGQRQHISQNRQPHLNAHKSLKKLTPSHTTRHDTEATRLSVPNCSVMWY